MLYLTCINANNKYTNTNTACIVMLITNTTAFFSVLILRRIHLHTMLTVNSDSVFS